MGIVEDPTFIPGQDLTFLMARDLKPPTRILGNWLTKSSIGMIYGWRGVGKTMFSMQLALSISTGKAFGMWPVHSSVRCAYVDGEMGPGAFQARVANYIEWRTIDDLPPNRFSYISYAETKEKMMYNLADPYDQRLYDKILAYHDVIIIDNMATCIRALSEKHRVHGDVEVDSWLFVQQWAVRQRDNGKTIIFVQHEGKSGSQRGSSRHEDVMDWIVRIKPARPPDEAKPIYPEFEISFEKGRNLSGRDADPVIARLADQHSNPQYKYWEMTYRNDEIYAKVLNAFKGGASIRDVVEDFGVSYARARALQREYLDTVPKPVTEPTSAALSATEESEVTSQDAVDILSNIKGEPFDEFTF